MTKKDYKLFAKRLFDLNTSPLEKRESYAFNDIFEFIAGIFAEDNRLFNYSKFKTACYEGKHIRKSIKGE